MKKFFLISLCLIVLFLYSVTAELVPVYEGEIGVNVGEDVEVVVGDPLEFNVTESCVSGESRCLGTDYYLCINNKWINKGQVNGKCGYSSGGGAGGGTTGGAGGGTTGGAGGGTTGGTGSSGGSGNNDKCSENWVCSGWTECVDERQTRTCEDLAECKTTTSKPSTTRSCEINELSSKSPNDTLKIDSSKTNKNQDTFFSAITGAVTGTLGETGAIGALIFIIGILVIGVFIAVMKKKRR